MITPGNKAYLGYCRKFPGPARDLAMRWEDLPPEIKECWEEAAREVMS